MTNPIDDAITTLLQPLGDGWHVVRVEGNVLRFETVGKGATNVISGYRATIANHEWVQASGEGDTVGGAVAAAVGALRSTAQQVAE
jgi:hypothetical protein